MRTESRLVEYFPHSEVEIGLWREVDQPSGDIHTHDFTEIAIVEAGSGLHQFQKECLPVAAGDVFVVSPDYGHGWKETQDMTVINVMIGETEGLPLFQDLLSHPGCAALFRYEPEFRSSPMGKDRLRLGAKAIREVKSLTQRLGKALKGDGTSFGAMAKVHLLEIIAFLGEHIISDESPSNKNILAVAKVIDHLEQHYRQSVQVEDLAQMINLSTSSLFRLFEQAMKTSPIVYLNQLRLEKSCELLKNTDQSVTDIAFEVGFSDSNYFSRTFKKSMACSPREYRKAQRK
jgi:AraC family L-rhamnose operon transcriptional activator RhaR/AraC family L-rhamnose operon regulatory protein RhaS